MVLAYNTQLAHSTLLGPFASRRVHPPHLYPFPYPRPRRLLLPNPLRRNAYSTRHPSPPFLSSSSTIPWANRRSTLCG
jgi:hypothetical protein